MFDVLWVGDFSLESGRNVADDNVNGFVKKTAQMLRCEDDDVKSCVAFLEKKCPIQGDGNTLDFGGGLQHYFRDFAHHPTIVGLMFSLLSQFTEKSYGTDVNGNFIIVPAPEKAGYLLETMYQTKFQKALLYGFFIL